MFCENLADGYIWSDPPNYWENVVWPAYLKAHKHLFVDGDINGDAVQINSDSGSPTPRYLATTTARRPVAGLIVLPAEDETLERLVEISCIELKAFQTVLIEGATDWRFA
jgi:nicotinamide/nicotinate riboside kinase